LLERSRGNFLWAYIAVQQLNSCYTKADVEKALENLPSGMEALYGRMAMAVQALSLTRNGRLGQDILKWVRYAQRRLSIEELSDALDNMDVLEIQRAIDDVCGGFAVVDKDGNVALIHETAREYLIKRGHRDEVFAIDHKAAHDMLFKNCVQCLTNISLQAQILRNQPPALLGYATNAWFIHFAYGSFMNPQNLQTLVSFLTGPHILTWMSVAARNKQLRALVVASRYLTDVVVKLQKLQLDDYLEKNRTLALMEGWATDLVQIVGKFGVNMVRMPDAIHKLIPAFCPRHSITYRQFGRKVAKTLRVTGLTSTAWDDCLARFPFDDGIVASSVLPAGSRIAVLTRMGQSSFILIYCAAKLEEQLVLGHPEHVSKIQVNKLGSLLVSYGYLTTRLWSTETGNCLRIVKNTPQASSPYTIKFIEQDSVVLIGTEDQVFRYFFTADNNPQWQTKVQIDGTLSVDTTIVFPTCSSINPAGNLVAFGYPRSLVTLWDLEANVSLSTWSNNLLKFDNTTMKSIHGGIYHIQWHPYSEEIFGLTQTGLLFRWDTHNDGASDHVQTGGNCLTVSGAVQRSAVLVVTTCYAIFVTHCPTPSASACPANLTAANS
jgi:WD40 repeat protein